MLIKKLDNLDNKEIKIKDDEKPTFNENIFQPYFRLNISGASGTGKSNAFINLYEKMYPQLTMSYVVSASLHNDKKQEQAFLDRENVMVFDNPSIELLQSITEEVESIGEKWREYNKMKKLYDKWKRLGYDETKLSPKELIMLYKINFQPNMMPYASNNKPNILLFLDDLAGLDILKHKSFENMVIKARHKMLNIALTNQSWKMVSPVWRRNSTAFMIFKTLDLNQIKGIFDEIQGLFKSFDEFMEAYNYATEEKHDFLYVDINDKTAPIRKNFNEVITF